MSIVERSIEAKLRDEYKYSDEEVEEFLKSFVDNMPTYKEKDPETVDVLYGFIDFQKFKTSMITFKKGVVDQKDTTTDKSEEDSI